MEKQSVILDKAVKISMIVAILVIALSVAYYLVVYTPQRDKIRLDQQLQQEESRKQDMEDKNIKEQQSKDEEKQKEIDLQSALQDCLDTADTDYSLFWDSQCEGQGLKKDCSLPQYNADSVEKSKKTDQDNCFKRFPQR